MTKESRRWAWAVGAAAGVLIAAGILLLRHTGGRPGVGAAAAASSSAMPASAVVAAASSATVAAERPVPSTVEVCGGARVPRGPDGAVDPARYREAIGLHDVVDRTLASTDWVLPLVLDHLPAGDESALAAFEMSAPLAGIATALPVIQYQTFTAYCANDRLADADRRQVCDGIASVMAEHSDELMGASIGVRVGERMDWPPERTELLRGELAAYGEVHSALSLAIWKQYAFECGPARKQLQRLRAMLALGEMEQMRAWIAASGKTPEDFVRIGHEQALRQAAPR